MDLSHQDPGGPHVGPGTLLSGYIKGSPDQFWRQLEKIVRMGAPTLLSGPNRSLIVYLDPPCTARQIRSHVRMKVTAVVFRSLTTPIRRQSNNLLSQCNSMVYHVEGPIYGLLNSLVPERSASNFTSAFFKLIVYLELISWALIVKMVLGECHITSW